MTGKLKQQPYFSEKRGVLVEISATMNIDMIGSWNCKYFYHVKKIPNAPDTLTLQKTVRQRKLT